MRHGVQCTPSVLFHACLTRSGSGFVSVNRRAVATRRWAYQSSVGAKEASQVLTVSGTLIHPSASTTRTRPTSSNTRGRSNIDLLLCTYRWEPLASTPTTKACNRQLHVLNTQNLRIEERADTASYFPRGCMVCARNTPTYGLSQFVLRSGSAAGIDSLSTLHVQGMGLCRLMNLPPPDRDSTSRRQVPDTSRQSASQPPGSSSCMLSSPSCVPE